MVASLSCPSGASFILGGQWGSEGKGAAAAWLATQNKFDIITTNAGAQAGHTSTHKGVTKVVFHLPTASLYTECMTYLNAGSIIDPEVLLKELSDNPNVLANGFFIHPNAAVITDECRAAEMDENSSQTRIASTRKGVGQALACKVLRSGMLAKDHLELRQFVRRHDLNQFLGRGKSVLVEVPQGHSLSIDEQFYPYCTSRNCTVMQAMSDAGIHPCFYYASMLVLRTFPIRVGNIYSGSIHNNATMLGNSGDCFPDQQEISWEQIGVKPEITTVTKRVRRVFSFSTQQVYRSIQATLPSIIYLTFCDYLPPFGVRKSQRLTALSMVNLLRDIYSSINPMKANSVKIYTQWGPTTDDSLPEGDLLTV